VGVVVGVVVQVSTNSMEKGYPIYMCIYIYKYI
jgi:hypothetical protein